MLLNDINQVKIQQVKYLKICSYHKIFENSSILIFKQKILIHKTEKCILKKKYGKFGPID
jgi:hypothetical protein